MDTCVDNNAGRSPLYGPLPLGTPQPSRGLFGDTRRLSVNDDMNSGDSHLGFTYVVHAYVLSVQELHRMQPYTQDSPRANRSLHQMLDREEDNVTQVEVALSSPDERRSTSVSVCAYGEPRYQQDIVTQRPGDSRSRDGLNEVSTDYILET